MGKLFIVVWILNLVSIQVHTAEKEGRILFTMSNHLKAILVAISSTSLPHQHYGWQVEQSDIIQALSQSN